MLKKINKYVVKVNSSCVNSHSDPMTSPFPVKLRNISGRGSWPRLLRTYATSLRHFRGGTIKPCFGARSLHLVIERYTAYSVSGADNQARPPKTKKNTDQSQPTSRSPPSYYPKGKPILSYVRYPESPNLW